MHLTIRIFFAGTCFLGPVGVQADEDESVRSAALFARLDKDGDGSLRPTEVSKSHATLFARLLRIADHDGDGELNRKEFIQAVQPSRPEKPLEEKRSPEFPGAAQTRLFLLLMDTNRDALIDQNEVPMELLEAFDRLVEVADRDHDDQLSRAEISRAAPQVSRLARSVIGERQIDVSAETRRLEESQGTLVNRFDSAGDPVANSADPDLAQQFFSKLDSNRDGRAVLTEVPVPIRKRAAWLFERVDRDDNQALSEQEFLAAYARLRQISRIVTMDQAADRPGDRPVINGATMSFVKRFLRRFDQNQSGTISREEAGGRLAARFDDVDSNENGEIEIYELRRILDMIQTLHRLTD